MWRKYFLFFSLPLLLVRATRKATTVSKGRRKQRHRAARRRSRRKVILEIGPNITSSLKNKFPDVGDRVSSPYGPALAILLASVLCWCSDGEQRDEGVPGILDNILTALLPPSDTNNKQIGYFHPFKRQCFPSETGGRSGGKSEKPQSWGWKGKPAWCVCFRV